METDNHALAWDIVNGFFAGMSLAGVRTIDPGPVEFAAAFARSWSVWEPATTGELAEFKPGRYGYKTLLYRARKPDSLFRNYRTSINALPSGLTMEQVLNTCTRHAAPDEWLDLARLYIRHSKGKDALPTQPATVRMPEEELGPSISLTVPVQQRNGIRVPGGIVRRRRHNSPDVPGYYKERREGGSRQNYRAR